MDDKVKFFKITLISHQKQERHVSKIFKFYQFFKKVSVFLFFPVISMSSKNGTTRFLKEGTIPYQRNEDDASNVVVATFKDIV